jgi:hypothetical protein
VDGGVTVDLGGAGGGQGAVAWMVGAFVVTVAVTRGIVRLIRSGKGPFRNTEVGGVHVHHQVYGIFLMLIAGAGEFVYRPDAPWLQVLAVVFGAGSALTLDEFALWLHLDDVYWTPEGRKSVDALLVATVVGVLLVLGARPFGDAAGQDRIAFAITIAVQLVCSLIAIVKGKIGLGVIGLIVPFLSVIAAIRLAKPQSPWAKRRYPPGSRRLERSSARYPPGRRNRWNRFTDLVGGAPSRPEP